MTVVMCRGRLGGRDVDGSLEVLVMGYGVLSGCRGRVVAALVAASAVVPGVPVVGVGAAP